MHFPILKREFKKLVPLGLIFFFISYNHCLLRGIKDILILTDGEVSTIYYLKLFGVAPTLILFAAFYGNLSVKLSRNNRFYIVISYFALFYFLFFVGILPNEKTLKLESLCNYLTDKFPQLSILWSIIKNWHTSIFYIHAEAWGAYALNVAFWTFANDITTFKQSNRFYTILTIGSHVGGIIAGISLTYFLKGNLRISIIITLIVIIAILLVFRFFTYKINKNPVLYEVKSTSVDIQQKETRSKKIGFFKAIKELMNSKYLMYIAFMVISYGFCISLFEAIWKDSLLEFSKGNIDFLASIYGNQMIYIGVISIFLSTILAPILIKKGGWKFLALFSPVAFAFTVAVFSIFTNIKPESKFVLNILYFSPLQISVILGLANIVFIKSSKFSFFDVAKESAYIPLKEELKIRGKTAIDGFGMVLGKGFGAVLITLLSTFFHGIKNIKNILIILIFVFIIIWVFSVGQLYKKLKKYTRTKM